MKFLVSNFLQSPVTSSLWGPQHPVLEHLQPTFYVVLRREQNSQCKLEQSEWH